jgi:hypothetical protein
MRERKRFNRYVVSTRLDGVFNLNIIRGQSTTQKLTILSVCQNCLQLLNFEGFRIEWSAARRKQAVRSFNLDRFFTKYPTSLHHETPQYSSDDAPLNNYTADFVDIGITIKEARQYRCDGCGFDCSTKGLRKFLHAHHVDGDKANNDFSNIKVLCLECHADEHHHMKGLPELGEFRQIKRSITYHAGADH